jgi:preprotein translocase subunit SecE
MAETNEKGKSVKTVKAVKTVDKNAPPAKLKPWTRVANFWRSFKSDIKKIVWPDRPQVIRKTGVVVGLILLVGAVVGLLDLAFGFGINMLGGIF